MIRRMILITALLALLTAWAGAQDIINGVISTTESTNAEGTVNDTAGGGDTVEPWGAGNVIGFIYVNFDEEGVQVSVDGSIGGNGLILYIDNGTNAGQISDFSNDSGRTYVGPWQRNLVVNAADKPDFFAAGWDGGALDLHWINNTTVSNVTVTSNVLTAATGGGGNPFVKEIKIPYATLYPGVGGNNTVPANAVFRVAAFIVGGDNYTGGDAAPGLTNTAPDNFPQDPVNGGGTALANAAQLNSYLSVTIDSNGDGTPDNFTATPAFAPTAMNFIFDNNLLELAFPEEVDEASAETLANYSVQAGPLGITLVSATKGSAPNDNKVYLVLSGYIGVTESITIRSENIAKASNLSLLSLQTDLTKSGARRVQVELDRNNGETIMPDNPIYLIGEWNGYSFWHGLSDGGPVDTLPDIPGVQSVDAVAGDGILTGYAVFDDNNPSQRYGYAIISEVNVAPFGNVQYDAGYFSPQFDRLLLASNDESRTFLNFSDPWENRLLQVPTTVDFTFRIPSGFATQGDLTAPGVAVRLQGGRNFGLGNILPPLQTGGADVGQVMTLDSGASDANFTVFRTQVTFVPGTNVFDVTSYRFVIDDLSTGDWYPPDVRQIDQAGNPPVDPEFKETSIHINVLRVYGSDGAPNHQDVTLEFIDGAYRLRPLFDVPVPPVFTAADKAWELYQ